MRKVILTMKAQEQYEIIKRLAEGHISKNYAAIKIGCTKRHINRLLKKYSLEGKAGFYGRLTPSLDYPHLSYHIIPIHTIEHNICFIYFYYALSLSKRYFIRNLNTIR